MRNLIIYLLVVGLSGCLSHKKVTYFNDISESRSGELAIPEAPELRFQPNDVVEVDVTSNSKETNEFFYKPGSDVDQSYAGNTYRVSRTGHISLPLVGEVAIGGLTADEANTVVLEKLLTYMKNPTVDIRLVSFQITVLGEVDKPGVYDIRRPSITLLEALGYAGDLTIFGKRDNLLIIRDYAGEKAYYRLSILDTDFISSPGYFLRNNDVVYVEPSKGRTSADDNAYRILPLILSALTFVVVFITLTQ